MSFTNEQAVLQQSAELTDILYTKDQGVATITINRPEVYNAFRGETAELATTEITCHMASLQNLSIQSARHAKPFCSVRSLPCGMK